MKETNLTLARRCSVCQYRVVGDFRMSKSSLYQWDADRTQRMNSNISLNQAFVGGGISSSSVLCCCKHAGTNETLYSITLGICRELSYQVINRMQAASHKLGVLVGSTLNSSYTFPNHPQLTTSIFLCPFHSSFQNLAGLAIPPTYPVGDHHLPQSRARVVDRHSSFQVLRR